MSNMYCSIDLFLKDFNYKCEQDAAFQLRLNGSFTLTVNYAIAIVSAIALCEVNRNHNRKNGCTTHFLEPNGNRNHVIRLRCE